VKSIREIRDMIDNSSTEPSRHSIDHLLNIIVELVEHIEKCENTAKRASNTASCLANGIQPD
jgi:hypothetical protein